MFSTTLSLEPILSLTENLANLSIEICDDTWHQMGFVQIGLIQGDEYHRSGSINSMEIQ